MQKIVMQVLTFYRPLATTVAFVNKYTYRPRVTKSRVSARNLYGSKGLFKYNAHVNFYGYTLQYETNKKVIKFVIKRIC